MKALLVKRSILFSFRSRARVRVRPLFEVTGVGSVTQSRARRASFNFTSHQLAHSKWRRDDLTVGARGLFELGRLSLTHLSRLRTRPLRLAIHSLDVPLGLFFPISDVLIVVAQVTAGAEPRDSSHAVPSRSKAQHQIRIFRANATADCLRRVRWP